MEFTGDFKKLKSFGFERMKLYADNRIIYNLDNIWVHKRYGGEIEISDFKNYTKEVYEKIIKVDFSKISKEDELLNNQKYITVFLRKNRSASNVLVFKGFCTRRFKEYHSGIFISESEVKKYIEIISIIQNK